MNSVTACIECLRRSWLLDAIAPYIEKTYRVEGHETLFDLLALPSEKLVERLAPQVAVHLLARTEAFTERKLHQELAAAECWATCRHCETYPTGLRESDRAPWALIGRGDRELLKGLAPIDAVALLGSSRSTAYGREVARELGRELAAAGVLVATGLGFGIEGCALRGAIDSGRAAAVLACGPDTAHPAAHRSLWRRICEEAIVVSELRPGASAWTWTYAARDRIIAGLADMTIFVEAANGAGSLRAADLAVEFGRDVGAVPGPVTSRASQGTNALLAGGACLVRDAQDILDAQLGPGQSLRPPPVAPELRGVLEAVQGGETTCDGIAASTGLSASEAIGALARLELLGYIERSPLGAYSPVVRR